MNRLSAELIANFNEDVKAYPDYAKVLFHVRYLNLLSLHASRGEYDQALATITKLRELDGSQASKQVALFEEAWLKAKQESADESKPEFRKAFERHFAAAFRRFAYKDVAETAQAIKSRLALANTDNFRNTPASFFGARSSNF